jgi:hypothetical protein
MAISMKVPVETRFTFATKSTQRAPSRYLILERALANSKKVATIAPMTLRSPIDNTVPAFVVVPETGVTATSIRKLVTASTFACDAN